jgi:hypothetical protein
MNTSPEQLSFIKFMEELVYPKLTLREKSVFPHRLKDILGVGTNEKTFREMGKMLGITGNMTRVHTVKTRRKVERVLSQVYKATREPQVIIKEVSVHEVLEANRNLPMRPKYVYDIIELTVRQFNCLANENLLLLDNLLKTSKYELRKAPNIGKKSIQDLEDKLLQHGLKLGMLEEVA